MNAIIVGANGRPSILDMMRTFDFDSEVVMYTYLRSRRKNKTIWQSYTNLKHGLTHKRGISEPSFNTGDKVIMWGTRVQIELGNAIVYNHPKVSNNASNKKIAREIFEEKDIAAPKLIKHNELYKAPYPVIIRKDRHRAGIEFYIANNDLEATTIVSKLNGAEYYISEIYPKTAEYRVHCASGKALLVKQKPSPEDKSVVAWNFHQNQLPWSTIDRAKYDFDMVSLSLKAIDALGLDYGAVDIMSEPSRDGFPKHVVVEVNTAPSYTPYLISKYGAYFNKIFSESTKLEAWDHSKFKKGKSLSWKNKQLNNK